MRNIAAWVLVLVPFGGVQAQEDADVRGYASNWNPVRYRVVVDPAPEADPAKVTVDWEDGSGHGFTLALHRTRWNEKGLNVRRLSYLWKRPRRKGEQPVERVWVDTTTIPREQAVATLRRTLAATGLRLEKKPAPEDSEPGKGKYWMLMSSTADFHAAVVVHDGSRVVFRDTFTGYAGSNAAVKYVRAKACIRILEEALERCTWTVVKDTQEDLAVLAARLRESGPDSWWVRERLLLMARAIGDKRCLPALRAQIELEPIRIPRDHAYAIDAYARISGVDLRPEPFGVDQVAETRRKYLAHFRSLDAKKAADKENGD